MIQLLGQTIMLSTLPVLLIAVITLMLALTMHYEDVADKVGTLAVWTLGVTLGLLTFGIGLGAIGHTLGI